MYCGANTKGIRETASQYIAELRALVAQCGFRLMENEFIRDQLVSNVYRNAVKLPLKEDLTLGKCSMHHM